MLSQLLFSNYRPAKLTSRSLPEYFLEALDNSAGIKIASGYISTDALAELKEIISDNNRPRLDLLIGMHHFDGFTRPQYQVACDLAQLLKERNLGNVYVATAFPFHGKMYSFYESSGPFASVIGSSNFSSVIKNSSRLYETDLVVFEPNMRQQIHENIDKLISSIGKEILTLDINTFIERNPLLDKLELAIKLDTSSVSRQFSQNSSYCFEIPIKTLEAPKSSLNVFFGKGRKNPRGLIKPRSWYEAELNIPKSIADMRGFPFKKEFLVITDDGWKFKCKTGGTNSKNLRSMGDLQILGRWMKGRLEQNGSLRAGELVTDKTLSQYGRRSFTLRSTAQSHTWLIDFKA